MTKAYLLQEKVHHYTAKGMPGLPEVEDVDIRWESFAIFHDRAKACEYAYDRGSGEWRVLDYELNPTTQRRDR